MAKEIKKANGWKTKVITGLVFASSLMGISQETKAQKQDIKKDNIENLDKKFENIIQELDSMFEKSDANKKLDINSHDGGIETSQEAIIDFMKKHKFSKEEKQEFWSKLSIDAKASKNSSNIILSTESAKNTFYGLEKETAKDFFNTFLKEKADERNEKYVDFLNEGWETYTLNEPISAPKYDQKPEQATSQNKQKDNSSKILENRPQIDGLKLIGDGQKFQFRLTASSNKPYSCLSLGPVSDKESKEIEQSTEKLRNIVKSQYGDSRTENRVDDIKNTINTYTTIKMYEKSGMYDSKPMPEKYEEFLKTSEKEFSKLGINYKNINNSNKKENKTYDATNNFIKRNNGR